MTTPSGTVTYTFDELNRLKTATDLATGRTTYTYDNIGNLETITYPNGTVAEYTYDALNRLTYLENRTSDGTVISSYAYTLDDAGNRTKVVEHTGRTVEYTYDDTYKLLEEKITNPDSSVSVISYTYDKVGNRLTKTENGFTTTYQYDDNNRLIQEDDITYSYDDNGNLKAKNSVEENIKYYYDAENHLTRVETTRFGVTIVVEYEYDAERNRVRKIIDGTLVTNYLVDTNRDYAQVLEERDGSGNLLVRYVYGHDLISQTRGGATTYYHYDGLGSTRALTSSAEVVTDTYNYDAFGNLLDKTGTTTNDYLYTGEFFDANIGFYYLRARYMNSAIGRFITIDEFAGSIRDPYSLHKYLYAHANPVENIDPSGHMTMVAVMTNLYNDYLTEHNPTYTTQQIRTGIKIGVTLLAIVGVVGGDTAIHREYEIVFQNVVDLVEEAVLELIEEMTDRKRIGPLFRGLHPDDMEDLEKYHLILSEALRTPIKLFQVFRQSTSLGETALDLFRQMIRGDFDSIRETLKKGIREFIQDFLYEPGVADYWADDLYLSPVIRLTSDWGIAFSYARDYGTNTIAEVWTNRAEYNEFYSAHQQWAVPLILLEGVEITACRDASTGFSKSCYP